MNPSVNKLTGFYYQIQLKVTVMNDSLYIPRRGLMSVDKCVFKNIHSFRSDMLPDFILCDRQELTPDGFSVVRSKDLTVTETFSV
jgi:hypothetical protein